MFEAFDRMMVSGLLNWFMGWSRLMLAIAYVFGQHLVYQVMYLLLFVFDGLLDVGKCVGKLYWFRPRAHQVSRLG